MGEKKKKDKEIRRTESDGGQGEIKYKELLKGRRD